VDDLTTVDVVIIAPRPADRIRRRGRAAQRRAVGRVPHIARPAVPVTRSKQAVMRD